MLYKPKKIDYTSPAFAQGGPGVSKSFPWFVGTPYLNLSRADFLAMGEAVGLTLGDTFTFGGPQSAGAGNTFMVVKAEEALALGQLVAAADPSTGTTTVPGSTTSAVLTNVDTSTQASANLEVDNWFWTVDSTVASANASYRRIQANTKSATATFTIAGTDKLRPASPADQDVLASAVNNGDACAVIRPFNRKVCTASTTPIGVALGTVTAGNYTIIQIAGHGVILADGTVNALVANQPAIPMAGGKIKGSAAAAANLYTGAGLILPQYATSAAGTAPIACIFNFTGQ